MSQGQNSERTRLIDIALPDQLPPIPRMPTDPSSLHSGTVESLLVQNEDLTARLAVSHRRNGEMERRIREIQCEYNELQKRLEVLSDQILVYREKDKAIKGRQFSYEKNVEQLKSQLEMQNIRYADLYNESKRSQTLLTDTNLKLSKELNLLKRYRQRISDRIAPLLKRQAKKLGEQKATLIDLHKVLGESGEHIRKQKDQISELQDKLQRDQTTFSAEIEKLQALQEKYIKLKEERTVHQNRVIAAERMRDDILSKHREETKSLQESVSQFRGESKTLRLDLQDVTARLHETEEIMGALREENDRLRDQTESLQALWTSTSKKLEASAAKEESLQKLNQELSRQLKEYRSSEGEQTQQYLTKIEAQEQAIQLLTTEIQILKASHPVEQKKAAAAVSLDTVKKLENLLAEIQSGYEKGVSSLPMKLEGYSFLETPELVSEQGDLNL